MAVTRIPLSAGEKQRHDDRLDLSLAEIHLAVRTVNCLEDEGIYTVRELLNRTPQQLLAIPNLGKTTLKTIYAALGKIGFCKASPQPRKEHGEGGFVLLHKAAHP